MVDIVAIGEALIDFSPLGKGKMGNPAFEMNPGGAPANCLAAASALGGKCAFIGMVGKDMFGDFLINSLKRANISVEGVKQTDKANTTMAFVSVSDNGERNFSFLRNPGADILLNKNDVDLSLIDKAQVVHFGSLSLTDEPSRTATLNAIKYAKKQGKLISYDPNYRPLLWTNEDTAKKWMLEGMRLADIVKMSDEEMELLTGYYQTDYKKGAQQIIDMGKKYVFVTCGSKGSFYMTQNEYGFCNGYHVKAVDTTGCGDAFTGSLLYLICNKTKMSMREMVCFANGVGAVCATKMGGLPAMPSMGEVERLV